jgi:hypothetical protein
VSRGPKGNVVICRLLTLGGVPKGKKDGGGGNTAEKEDYPDFCAGVG